MSSEVPTTFFSYSRDDSDFALKLAHDLKAGGANVWIDQLDIQPGQEWDSAIEAAVIHAPRILLILSPSSVNSRDVRNEITFALDENKTIIPILYEDCTVPLQLRRVQYVDFRIDYSRGLNVLLRTLGVDKGQQEEGEQKGSRRKTGGVTKAEPKAAVRDRTISFSVDLAVTTPDNLRNIKFGLEKDAGDDDTVTWTIHFKLQERDSQGQDFIDVVTLDVDVREKNFSAAEATAKSGLSAPQVDHLNGPVTVASQKLRDGDVTEDKVSRLVEDTLPKH